MPKVQSRRKRTTKSEPFETMMVDEPSNPEQVVEEGIVDEESVGGESNHAVYKRHAGEWKRMKSQVAQLKKQRKSLTKKQRDKKKEISQEIKLLISSTGDKHQAELRALGIIAPKRADMMIDDEDDE